MTTISSVNQKLSKIFYNKNLFRSLFVFLSFIHFAYAQETVPSPAPTPIEESSIYKLESIKKILQKDKLDMEVENKNKAENDLALKKEMAKQSQFNYPIEEKFWPFIVDYWLVKNSTKLKWDNQRPDYGIVESLESLFESLGFYEKKFRILFVDNTSLTHFSFPYNKEIVFLISVPFIRTLDLSKMEIAVMLLEDYYRVELGILRNNLLTKEVSDLLGSSFYQKNFDKKIVEESLKKIDSLVFEKGFSFEDQFNVTKTLYEIIKNDPKLVAAYNQLLTKIDFLVKSNLLYKNYTKIFPSPELQLGWINPKEKKL